jgi:hypothetical protein
LEAKVQADAANVAEVAPEGTVTDAGTFRNVELEVSDTVPPDEPERVTVQVVDACEANDPAAQVRAVGITAGATSAMAVV